MSDIKITWKKLATILISIVIFVFGLAYCGAYNEYRSKVDIEAVQDVAYNKAQV